MNDDIVANREDLLTVEVSDPVDLHDGEETPLSDLRRVPAIGHPATPRQQADDDDYDDDSSQQQQQQQQQQPQLDNEALTTCTTAVFSTDATLLFLHNENHESPHQLNNRTQSARSVISTTAANAMGSDGDGVGVGVGGVDGGNNTTKSGFEAVPSNAPSTPPAAALATTANVTQARRLYRKDANSKWVTREIAALEFLMSGIPLAAEETIVQQGFLFQQKLVQEMRGQLDSDDIDDEDAADLLFEEGNLPRDVAIKGRWWEKWIKEFRTSNHGGTDGAAAIVNKKNKQLDEQELELPVPSDRFPMNDLQLENGNNNNNTSNNNNNNNAKGTVLGASYVPGRRLQGDDAVRIQIPLTTKTLTKQKSIARQAALREWELQTAHGLKRDAASPQKRGAEQPPMLDGRLFFSASGSYPVSVFSLIRYEPRKEEMQQRRQKLEALGGGGTHFVMPSRDWRGISYRSLLKTRRPKYQGNQFNRFLRNQQLAGGAEDEEAEDEDSISIASGSSDDSHVYVPGLLDDAAMVLGRHRKVMIGDRVTGPIVSSTIQFVRPALLKAELNKQFRERFDGWEPPRGARKYIGAKVVDGEYKLMDPTEDDYHDSMSPVTRKDSVASASSTSDGPSTIAPKEKQLRIPPSLTLSKIRSLKQQALAAAVKAKLEIGTVALACVYFERLCLDCRVDKSNRRLAFASCLLLALKLNEPNVGLVIRKDEKTASNDGMANRLQSLIRPNKRSKNIFASLLEFFTEKWNLSLKNLFDAEWGVFAALGFSLHAKPSHIAFHFKRLMKQLEWNPRTYLGEQMYDQWQETLENEEDRRRERQKRRDKIRRRKEEQILNLRIEMENEVMRRKASERGTSGSASSTEPNTPTRNNSSRFVDKAKSPRMSGMRLLNRFGMRRTKSHEKLRVLDDGHDHLASSEHLTLVRPKLASKGISASPSMPNFSTASTMTTTSTAPRAPLTSGLISIDIPHTGDDNDASSIGSVAHSDKGIIL